MTRNKRTFASRRKNWLIHGYFKVDLDAVWSMIEQDLPPLKQDTRRILGSN